jgi:hypothetical protein
MSKKLIVEVGLLNKMFSMFFKAKENHKEDEFIDNLGKKNENWEKFGQNGILTWKTLYLQPNVH